MGRLNGPFWEIMEVAFILSGPVSINPNYICNPPTLPFYCCKLHCADWNANSNVPIGMSSGRIKLHHGQNDRENKETNLVFHFIIIVWSLLQPIFVKFAIQTRAKLTTISSTFKCTYIYQRDYKILRLLNLLVHFQRLNTFDNDILSQRTTKYTQNLRQMWRQNGKNSPNCLLFELTIKFMKWTLLSSNRKRKWRVSFTVRSNCICENLFRWRATANFD